MTTERNGHIITYEYGYSYAEEIRKLFGEYTHMLVTEDPSFQAYLDLHGYEEEVRHLEKKYGLPAGRLYIVWVDGTAAGCIGLRKLDEERCEMKRFYVRPEFRGLGIGRMMVERILEDAREIGYKSMLLDTLPFMKSALHLYAQVGFYEIPAYNDSPVTTTIFLKKDLA